MERGRKETMKRELGREGRNNRGRDGEKNKRRAY